MSSNGNGVTRREVLIGAAGGLALAAIEAPRRRRRRRGRRPTVSGVVFDDRDGSGAPGADNPGIAGALVSNGRDVALHRRRRAL